MLRKQRKLQPWRRFGYVILIIIKSGELLLWFSPRIINGLRSYIKHSKGCFIWYPNTLKLVKKNLGCASFFQPLLGVWISDETLFLVFDILLVTTELLSTKWYKTKTESDANDQSRQRKLSEFIDINWPLLTWKKLMIIAWRIKRLMFISGRAGWRQVRNNRTALPNINIHNVHQHSWTCRG